MWTVIVTVNNENIDSVPSIRIFKSIDYIHMYQDILSLETDRGYSDQIPRKEIINIYIAPGIVI